MKSEVAALRAQLEQEQAVAAERQANHANVLAQLEDSRWAAVPYVGSSVSAAP